MKQQHYCQLIKRSILAIGGQKYGIGLILALLVSYGSGPALADTLMTGEEIKASIVGNSLSGLSQYGPYKQHVRPDGIAVVRLNKNPIKNVHWSINEKNEYCEDWSPYGVFCNPVKRGAQDNKLVFLRDDGSEGLSTIHKGYIDLAP